MRHFLPRPRRLLVDLGPTLLIAAGAAVVIAALSL